MDEESNQNREQVADDAGLQLAALDFDRNQERQLAAKIKIKSDNSVKVLLLHRHGFGTWVLVNNCEIIEVFNKARCHQAFAS